MTLSWLALVSLVLCGAWFLGNGDSAATVGYRLADTTQAASSLVLIGPILAGLAAVAGDRWAAGGWPLLPWSRPAPRVAAAALWPFPAVAWLALLVVGLLAVPGGQADLRVMGTAWAMVSGLAVLGFGVGTRLRAAWAAPAVMVTAYLFFALPLIMEPLWLRQMTGMWSGCCAVDQDLDPRASAAVLAVAGALGVAGLVLGFTRGSVVAAASIAAAGLVVGAALVAKSGPDPVVARDVHVLVCADRLCLWPEHDSARGRALIAVAAVDRAGKELSLRVPARYSEAEPARFGGLSADPRASDPMLLLSSTSALLPSYSSECAAQLESTGAQGYPYEVVAVARGVLATRAGLPVSDLAGLGYDGGAVGAVEQLATHPTIGRWLERVQSDIAQCQPHGLPLASAQ